MVQYSHRTYFLEPAPVLITKYDTIILESPLLNLYKRSSESTYPDSIRADVPRWSLNLEVVHLKQEYSRPHRSLPMLCPESSGFQIEFQQLGIVHHLNFVGVRETP